MHKTKNVYFFFVHYLFIMSLQDCLYCNKRVGKSDMDTHVRARHNVSTRDNSGFEKSVVIVEGEEYPVWVKGHIYRCGYCTIEAQSLKFIQDHVYGLHVVTYDEKRNKKVMRIEERKQQYKFCDICWQFFHSDSMSLDFSSHKSLTIHKKKLKYEEGTGCDVCRTSESELEKHIRCDEDLHITHLNYKEGSGCDVCRGLDCTNHEEKELYVEGSGCDICKIVLIPHEETNKHKRTERKMLRLYKRFIAPTIRAKSARK